MVADNQGRRNSNTHLSQELEALSESIYQSHISTIVRRTTSLVFPRSTIPPISSIDEIETEKFERLNPKPRLRRMSLSPSRPLPELDKEEEQRERSTISNKIGTKNLVDESATSEKKRIWRWKPIRGERKQGQSNSDNAIEGFSRSWF
ncbi:Hypothetical predicted protein [Olea europaea subsp. europaea]|uniref:Uncharacterized protein n=1 Tax=Olea europaea subsp. europaea TaxID=158383 RepID=A0A8S0TJG0_OLEEU|nr:Hypothetical predicted protein [Olea europaea subsp. europaea]